MAKVKWSFLIFFVYLQSIVFLTGQTTNVSIPYKTYQVSDGLAQMQVRDIFIDDDNYVWIGTQGGVSGYDGSNILTFKNLSGLSEKYIVRMFRGKNALYGTTQDEFFTYDGDTVRFISFPDKNYTKATFSFQDNKGVFWIVKQQQGKKRMFALQNDSLVPIHEIYPSVAGINFNITWGNPSWEYCYILDDNNLLYTFNPSNGELASIKTPFLPTDKLQNSSNRTSKIHDIQIKKIVNSKVDEIYTIDSDTLLLVAKRDTIKDTVKKLSPFATLGFVSWYNEKSTVHVLKDSTYRTYPNLIFNQIRFCVNHDNRIYVATDEGLVVIHLNGLETINLPECDYPWSAVPNDNGHVFVGCYESGVFEISHEGHIEHHYDFISKEVDQVLKPQILSNFLTTKDKLFFGSVAGFNYLSDQDNTLRLFKMPYPVEAFAIDRKSGHLLFGSDNVYILNDEQSRILDTVKVSDEVTGNSWLNDIVISEESELWVAGSNGIQHFEDNYTQNTMYQKEIGNLPCIGAVTFELDDKNRLWAGATCGLIRYEPTEDKFVAILPEVIENRVNQLLVLPQDQLACVSLNQLFLLDISTEPPTIIAQLDEKNGLNLQEPSENGISITNDRYIYLPSSSGLQRLDLDNIRLPTSKPQLVVLNVNGKSSKMLFGNNNCVETETNSALVNVTVPDNTGRKWKYRYRIKTGEFSPWQYSNELLVTDLNHGMNQVTIQSSWYTTKPITNIEKTICIKAFVPFWSRKSTTVVLFLLIITSIALIVGITLKGQADKRKYQRLKLQLYNNRLKTIQAYLNPHFLFNALTTVQDYILHHDRKAGSDLVVKLSRVFRRVLDFGAQDNFKLDSDIPLIKLSDEIALIEDMVELQNKQLKVPVAFTVKVPDRIKNSHLQIPPMLIQPFVENSFKHAFKSGQEVKSIILDVIEDKGYLVISITDNGIGFNKERSSKATPSMGFKLAKERMDLLNALHIENEISINKLQPHGTEVRVSLKKIHESNNS